MEIRGGRRAVMAGLAATLGVTAALAATPVVALASEETPDAAAQAVAEADAAAALSSAGEALAMPQPVEDTGETLSAETPAEDAVPADPDQVQAPANDAPAVGTADDAQAEGAEETGDVASDSLVDGPVDVAPEGETGDEDAPAEEAVEAADEADAEGQGEPAGELLGAEDSNPEAADVLVGSASTWVRGDDGAYQWYDATGSATAGGWVVTDRNLDNSVGGLQRYWIDPLTGTLAIGRLVDPTEGSGYWAYATLDGWVVRGKYVDPETGYVYFADNDGRLAGTGWVVSDAYGDGLQRYWIDEEAHAAIPGYSTDGWEHYTTAAGYVVRGKHAVSEGGRDLVYLADNDGRLAGSGWVVSDAYGDGLQRYWVDEGAHAAVVGYSTDGWAHYTTERGYVLRGASVDSRGNRRWANNDGLLPEGWIVTGDFTNGALERYWQEGGLIAAGRVVDAGNGWWAYATSTGAVIRGTGVGEDGRVYLANNEGMLVSGSGWLVSSQYGYGIQRYYLEPVAGTGYSYVRTGFFQASIAGYDSAWFYGDTSRGYVARGKYSTSNGVLVANNEGVLIESVPGVGAGMYVTGDFDGGILRRYYLVNVDGHLYAKTGSFVVDGNHYYGYADQGYLIVGRTSYGSGLVVATDEGVLLWRDGEGWVVTDAFDGALQRYYLIDLGGGLMGARLGLFSVGGSQYYGREDTGYVVRGTYTAPDGRVFHADDDGKLVYTFLTSAGWSAWNRIKDLYSWTQYLIAVDTDANRTIVFQGGYIASKGCYGNWTPIYDWSCSTGNRIYNGGQGTVRGTFTIGGDGADYNWNSSGNYTPGGYRTTYWASNDVKYFTGFILNLGFHSTVGVQGGYSDYGQLGGNITHGCIRLLEANARWIYYNALPGTKVVVF